jgi:hypothetical protein
MSEEDHIHGWGACGSDYHTFTISGGPFGPIPGTHVFPRSPVFGELIAGLLETTAIGSDPYTFGNINVDQGGYYRGENEIVLPGDFPCKQREGIKIVDTWNGLRKRLRACRGLEKLDDYHANNPERKGEANRERNREQRSHHYLSKKFVAVDLEGQDYLGNVINRPNGSDCPTPYDDHRLFMAGAASIDDDRPPVWLKPAATSSSEIPIAAGDMLTLSAPTPHGRQK